MADTPLGTIIVTGASRGIGAAVARLAGTRGYAVAVNYGKSAGRASEVVDHIVRNGGRASAIHGDIAREADVMRLFETAERDLGPITALVNNAGSTGGISRVEDVTAETLEEVMGLNVIGTILCAREAVRRMSTKRGGGGGSIVNISSLAVRTGGPGEWVHYAASKGAIDSFTIGLAREVGSEGIRVNAVSPGLIDTELHANSGAPERLGKLSPSVPMQRSGSAEEVADAVLYLLSSKASYITGSMLEVGGGR